jgi:anti-sigma factor RsiW
MSEGYAGLDAHAYVDNSLSPSDRAEFEAALRRDPKLRARVEAWEAQNEAIRLAFGAAAKTRQAPAIGRPSNENELGAKAPVARDPSSPLRGRPAPPPAVKTAPRRYIEGWRKAALSGVAFVVGVATFAGGPGDPRLALMRRADAALRSAPAFIDSRLDLTSDDPRVVAAWLGARFARVEAKRLSPPGWSLLGVRIVPGVASAAALVLYEDALGGRAGLLLEPTDALPDLPTILARDSDETILAGAERGFAYAVVGPTPSGVGALIPAPAGE